MNKGRGRGTGAQTGAVTGTNQTELHVKFSESAFTFPGHTDRYGHKQYETTGCRRQTDRQTDRQT